jgi:hypothetical protein
MTRFPPFFVLFYNFTAMNKLNIGTKNMDAAEVGFKKKNGLTDQ